MSNVQDGFASSHRDLSSECSDYLLSVTTTSARITLAPGSYEGILTGADPTVLAHAAPGDSSVTAVAPTSGNSVSGTFGWRADRPVKFAILPGQTHLAVILSAGSYTFQATRIA